MTQYVIDCPECDDVRLHGRENRFDSETRAVWNAVVHVEFEHPDKFVSPNIDTVPTEENGVLDRLHNLL